GSGHGDLQRDGLPRLHIVRERDAVRTGERVARRVAHPLVATLHRTRVRGGSLTKLYPACAARVPAAFHTRPPSFATVTLIIRVSPAVQLIGTLSLTPSALQSAPRQDCSPL